MEHVDYPHWPGALHDCLACESECHCGDLSVFTLCIFCDGITEQDEC